jgi:hypothetical protein
MAYTYSKIATYTVGSGGVASIDFLNIPQTYTDLHIVCTIRFNGAASAGSYGINLNINGTSTNRTGRWLYATGATPGSATITSALVAASGGTGATANTFSNTSIYIPNYTSSTYKSMSIDSVMENNATSPFSLDLLAGLRSVTDPITSLSISGDSPNLIVQYSTAHLYGIKAEL